MIEFSFPKDHPHAERIRRVFAALATYRKLQSGLVIHRTDQDDAAVAAALSELRSILAEEGVDLDTALQRDLASQDAQARGPAPAGVDLSSAMGTLVQRALSDPAALAALGPMAPMLLGRLGPTN